MKQYSLEISPEHGPAEGPVRRSIHSPDHLVNSPAEGVTTLYEVLQHGSKKFGDRNLFGYRKLERMVEEEKEVKKIVDGVEKTEIKKWKFFQLSGYYYYSYKDASKITHEVGAGLRKFGLGTEDKLEIFASTSCEWMLMAHGTYRPYDDLNGRHSQTHILIPLTRFTLTSLGCFTQALTIVTAYDTLGEEGLLHSMQETEAKAIFTNAELLATVGKVASKCTSLCHVIYTGDAKPELINKLREEHPQLQNIVSFDELRAVGREHPVDPVAPKAEDMCCIMYTSGSTGAPKGVILTHANLVAAISGVNRILEQYVTDEDCIMAYLPLAHVLEFLVENVCIFWGITLGYGSVRTLTDASVRNCQGDIKEFRPTFMTGVPAVWESIRKGVLTKIHASSPAVQKVFYTAFQTKAWCLEKGLPTGWLDSLVFNKIKDQVGGRLRFALSGGAPISPETQQFLSVTVAPILQGYGMTESCGMCAIMAPEQFAYGRVGAPVPCVEIKLVDVPDAGYRASNTPSQGEVWIRGGSITPGYFKRSDLTAETLTADGWLQTGDIGEWNENGTLSIIDRKKNLVKLSNGEYIALEKLESVYKSCLFVSNICVYGDSFQPKPVALVVPDQHKIRKLAEEKGIEERDIKKLCENEVIRKAVLDALIAQAKKGGLKPSEVLCDAYLTHEEWTSEQGLLTAAQKLKRKEINQKFKKELDDIKTVLSNIWIGSCDGDWFYLAVSCRPLSQTATQLDTMPDDPWDDWEAAADAGLDPPPPVKATTTKTKKKQSTADLPDEHERNKAIWTEATLLTPSLAREISRNTYQTPHIVRTDTSRTEYVPELKILKRPKNPGSTTYNPQTSQPQQPKTLAEREAEYVRAREKIFGLSSAAETPAAEGAAAGEGGASATGKTIWSRSRPTPSRADATVASVMRQPRPPDADGHGGEFRGGERNRRKGRTD
ncbi:hypothetical protein BC936DRAFT_145048 [Jimgerdemannia flammicorona]|uniref:SUZ domain-containing protein n=1 Tax=Jimgerdemannia flammicorona TaxID=994334 RepID=A0A433DB24_9FUNG|nr:hypothetical protein BC936DRAFT_145048 [Jimgerdemannia flammicorona]